MSGRRVRTLHDAHTAAGRYSMEWDGTDGARRAVASGVYFVEMRSPGFRAVERLVMAR